MNTTDFFLKKHRFISKTEKALLFVGENFLKTSKNQLPRERVTKKNEVFRRKLLGVSELKQQSRVGVLLRLQEKGTQIHRNKI